jgi:hypothetical protein
MMVNIDDGGLRALAPLQVQWWHHAGTVGECLCHPARDARPTLSTHGTTASSWSEGSSGLTGLVFVALSSTSASS